MSWVVEDKQFQRTDISSFSGNLMERIANWVYQYDRKQRERFVVALFSVFDRAGIKSIIDMVENKKLILKFILETKDIEAEVTKMIKDFVMMVIQVSSEVMIEEVKMMFQKSEKK